VIAEPYGLSPAGYAGMGMPAPDATLWDMYVLRPLFSADDKASAALIFGTVLIIAGLVISAASVKLARARYSKAGLNYE